VIEMRLNLSRSQAALYARFTTRRGHERGPTEVNVRGAGAVVVIDSFRRARNNPTIPSRVPPVSPSALQIDSHDKARQILGLRPRDPSSTMDIAMKAKPASCRIVASVPADCLERNKGQMERTRPVSAFPEVARL
jgi:hypothetical protein